MEDLSSGLGDRGRYTACAMKIRFGLRTCLLVIAIIAVTVGAMCNWHAKSMTQYRELTVHDPSDAGWYVEFSCDIETDWQTASLRPSANGNFTTTFHTWLCNFFDPLYVLKPVIAFAPEQDCWSYLCFRMTADLSVICTGGVRWVQEDNWWNLVLAIGCLCQQIV